MLRRRCGSSRRRVVRADLDGERGRGVVGGECSSSAQRGCPERLHEAEPRDDALRVDEGWLVLGRDGPPDDGGGATVDGLGVEEQDAARRADVAAASADGRLARRVVALKCRGLGDERVARQMVGDPIDDHVGGGAASMR